MDAPGRSGAQPLDGRSSAIYPRVWTGCRGARSTGSSRWRSALTDRLDRKLLFNVTLDLYLVAAALTPSRVACGANALFHFLTGAGIGGEYTAINSAIRSSSSRGCAAGRLIINGSFWIGAALGAAGPLVVLDPNVLGADLGWRTAFGIGVVLGLIIILQAARTSNSLPLETWRGSNALSH